MDLLDVGLEMSKDLIVICATTFGEKLEHT